MSALEDLHGEIARCTECNGVLSDWPKDRDFCANLSTAVEISMLRAHSALAATASVGLVLSRFEAERYVTLHDQAIRTIKRWKAAIVLDCACIILLYCYDKKDWENNP